MGETASKEILLQVSQGLGSAPSMVSGFSGNNGRSQGTITPAFGPQDSLSLHILSSLVPLFIHSFTHSYCVYYVCARHWENNSELNPGTIFVRTELTVYVERKPSVKG